MIEYVRVELDEDPPQCEGRTATTKDQADYVKSKLQDDLYDVVVAGGEVLVGVHDSRDAEEEITEKLNEAGVSCFVSLLEFDEVAASKPWEPAYKAA